MHPTTLEFIFSVACGLLVPYGIALFVAIWFAPSLKNQVVLHPRLWGNLPESKMAATTQALLYVFAGASFALSVIGARVASFVLFVPFVVCAVIMFGQRLNHTRGGRQA